VASMMWRELLERVWEVDPLFGPRSGMGMGKLAVIHDPAVLSRMLRLYTCGKNRRRARPLLR